MRLPQSRKLDEMAGVLESRLAGDHFQKKGGDGSWLRRKMREEHPCVGWGWGGAAGSEQRLLSDSISKDLASVLKHSG